MTADERRCLDQLLEWQARFDELMNMYDSQSPSPRLAVDKEIARNAYARLKADLADEHKMLSNSREPLNAAEQQWLRGPVHEASAHLRAPANSAPAKWFSDLYTSRGDIVHMVYQMRDYFGIPHPPVD